MAPSVYFGHFFTPGVGAVSVIATATNTVIATVLTDNQPFGIAFTPGGELAYVANFVGTSVQAIVSRPSRSSPTRRPASLRAGAVCGKTCSSMSVVASVPSKPTGRLSPELCLRVYELMLRARVLEERLITMYKQGEGFFWIGGPGEEAFAVPLGLLVDKGQGVNHDYLHLHYRASGTLLAMGADPLDTLRQMRNAATDPYSKGRNFTNHYSVRRWNVVPVTSPIAVQFPIALGTARAQRAGTGAKGITIVQGGDAGTAEGDFATALVWASRKGNELPLLMIVTNNRWGISTSYAGQHG